MKGRLEDKSATAQTDEQLDDMEFGQCCRFWQCLSVRRIAAGAADALKHTLYILEFQPPAKVMK